MPDIKTCVSGNPVDQKTVCPEGSYSSRESAAFGARLIPSPGSFVLAAQDRENGASDRRDRRLRSRLWRSVAHVTVSASACTP